MSTEASVADAISAFPSNVSPSDQDQLVLTRGELNRIIAGATKEIRSDIDDLRAEVAEERAKDRRRIAALEHEEPQPMQKDRAEILRALLAANGGKMMAKDARQKMHLSENRFSELLSCCDFIEARPSHLDKGKLVIILKSELLPWK
jgi:hypothetical protein